jgi:hypothetical protein
VNVTGVDARHLCADQRFGRGVVPSVDEYASTQTVHQLISIVTVCRGRDDPRAPSLEISEDGEGARRWMLVRANRVVVGKSSGASQPKS